MYPAYAARKGTSISIWSQCKEKPGALKAGLEFHWDSSGPTIAARTETSISAWSLIQARWSLVAPVWPRRLQAGIGEPPEGQRAGQDHEADRQITGPGAAARAATVASPADATDEARLMAPRHRRVTFPP
jgi:hypothetical protein